MPSSKKTTWYFQCKKEDYTKLNINLRVYLKYDIIEKNTKEDQENEGRKK